MGVGTLMLRSVSKINWTDFRQAFPAFLSIVMMPFTYSIAYGIISGLAMHAIIHLMDFVVYSCKTGWTLIQIKRGKIESNEKISFELFGYRKAAQMDADELDPKQQIERLQRKLHEKEQEVEKLTNALKQSQFSQ